MSKVSTDPISDMLTRLRNAILVSKNETSVPYSKFKEELAKLLKDYQLIDNYEVIQEDGSMYKSIVIKISRPDSNARITNIQRLSTPGRRIYARSNNIPKVKNGRGLVIVSTSYGLMTGSEAIKKGIGGELICKVY